MNTKLLLFFIAITPGIAMADPQISIECQDRLYALPELAPLIQKVGGLDVRNASFEALTNQDKASEQDKPLITKLANGLKACWDAVKVLQTPDQYQKSVKAFNTNENNRIMALADLYTQKISFGEYIKLRRESIEKKELAYQEADAEIAEYNGKIDEYNRNAQAQEEAARAQSLSDALSNMGKSLKDTYSRRSLPPPTICNSRVVGNSVQTNCN